ncbi:MAG: cell division protein CrgA [Actinomycetota bacterium]|jgi:hypothetical protein
MPVSRKRKNDDYTPVSVSREPVNLDSPRWIAPLMVTLLILGVLYIVAFYIAHDQIPVMKNLSGIVNIGIGFGLMAAGFIVSTRWR